MKRKIAAILAADIFGYSKLVAEDEEETLRRLASYRSVIDDFINKASGRIFNAAGDAILAEFPSAVDAVRCAIDIQESLRTRNLAYPPSRQMIFRIGITVGDVVERDGDLLGDGVNIAARLEGLAEPGGICVSHSVFEQVANKLSVRFEDIGPQQVKNIPTPIHAYVTAAPTQHNYLQAPQSKARTKLVLAIALLTVLFGAAGGVYWLSTPAPRTSPEAVSTATPPATPHTAQAPPPKDAATNTEPSAPSTAPLPPTAALPGNPPVTVHFDEAKARALATRQSIPLPKSIKVVEATSAVPRKAAEFLGAWGGDGRWGSGGRQMILLVTYVDNTGTVYGNICFGPPTARTSTQDPANYWAFAGKIADDNLRFDSPNGQWKYEFKILPENIMVGRLENPAHAHFTINIERIQ